MKYNRVEILDEAHKELLKVQFAKKLDGETETSLNSILSKIVNTVLLDEELRKKVLK